MNHYLILFYYINIMFQQSSSAFGFPNPLSYDEQEEKNRDRSLKKKSPFIPSLKIPHLSLPPQRTTQTYFAQNYTQMNQRMSIMAKPLQQKQSEEGLILHEDLGVQLRLNPELVMRRTAFNGSANAVARLYQAKRKKEQVLISINCSKATMPEKKTHQEDQYQGTSNQEGSYGLDQMIQTKSSKTPNLSAGNKQKLESQYHMSCRDGSSVLSTDPYNRVQMPLIQHKKNPSLYNETEESMYQPMIIAQGLRISSTNHANGIRSLERGFTGVPNSLGNKSVLLQKSQIGASVNEVDNQAQSRTMAQFHNSHRRVSAFTMYKKQQSNSKSPRQDKTSQDYADYGAKRVEITIQDEKGVAKRNEQVSVHRSFNVQSIADQHHQVKSHKEHFDAHEIDMEELFPKTESQKKPAVMYGRAIKQLKTILGSKGLKDSGAVLKNTNYGLLHFHIDTGLNDISLNKFDAVKSPVKRNSHQTRTVPAPVLDVTSAYNDQVKNSDRKDKSSLNSGRLSQLNTEKIPQKSKRNSNLINRDIAKNLEDSLLISNNMEEMPEEDLQIPSHFHLSHLQSATDHVDNFQEIEAEDYLSNSLVKDSPVLKLKNKKPVEKFMMHIRETINEKDDFSQASGQMREDISRSHKTSVQPQHKIMRTILFIKETSDQDLDWVNMDLKDFLKLKEEDLAKAYNKLSKVSMPVFSGAVNTLINKIDPKKVEDPSTLPSALQQAIEILLKKEPMNKKGKKRWIELNQVESELFEELKLSRDELKEKKMIYGLWQVMNQQGSLPHSREGGSASIIGSTLYLFGGFSRDVFGDFRTYDVYSGQWRILPQQANTPCARYSHTMLPYDKKLVVFGGAGGYVTTIKMRLSFNDVQIFDTDQEQWIKTPEIEGAPRKRMSHSASIMGGFMLVHGGYNTEQKRLLNDFGLFDLENQKWIQHKVFNAPEGTKIIQRIDDKHFHYDEVDPDVIGFRQNHTINAVCDQEYWNDQCNGRFKQKRVMWMKRRAYSHEENLKGLSFQEGFYLFGGVDQKGHTHNDLWLIQPHIEENELLLHAFTFEFLPHVKQSLSFKTTRLSNYSGRPPCPRIMHSSTVFRDWNKHFLLVIYGGRNDQIFARTQNVALNDICLFNLNKMEWQTLAMYGDVPCSRWSHCFTMNRGEGSGATDGFLVFGGVNLRNYCRSKVYQFQILNRWYQAPKGSKKGQDNEAGGYIDEKIQILAMQSKQKIDLIKEIVRKQED